MRISVKTIPGAGKEAVEAKDGLYVVRTPAIPEQGKANSAVIKLLAKYFNLAKNRVKIIRGHKNKHKIVEIE